MMSEDFAVQAWDNTAEYHFGLAIIQRPEAAGATVHEPYYCMFHAATAALLRTTGSAPKKHSGAIEQFGLLVRSRWEALKRAAYDLNKVEDSRIIADYGQVKRLSAGDGLDALNRARSFLDLCAAEFGFPRARSGGDG
jgi:uncharacterized protein (UPF0332 family)